MSEACFVYDSLVLEPACTGWFIVFFIFCCQFLLLLLFIRRRRIFPLAERAVPMTIGCLSQVLFLAEFLTQSKIYPCGVLVVGYLLQSQILLVCYLVRVWRLRCHMLASQGMQYQQYGTSQPNFNWYLLHRKLTSPSFVRKCLILYLFVLLAVIIPVAFVMDDDLLRLTPCVHSTTLAYINPALLLAGYLGMLFALRRVKRDSLGIKIELCCTAVGFVLIGVPFQVLRYYESEASYTFYPLELALMSCVVMGMGLVYPLVLSCVSSRTRARGVTEQPETLDYLLTSSSFGPFFEFLKSEFSAENLLFWVAIREYRALVTPRLDDIDFILNTYILVSAPFQVNISEASRNRTLEKVKLWSMSQGDGHTIFDEAQLEVFNLMNQDAYPRFVARNRTKQSMKAHILLDDV